jgi:hypothetical protein
MALTVRTKRILKDALCADKGISDEIIAKIQSAAALSERAKKVMKIMLPDKIIAAEVIAVIAAGGVQVLSTKAKLMLATAMCDKVAYTNLISELEA